MERGEPGTREYFDWFYKGDWREPGAVEERWHPDLIVHQSSDVPDTKGTFHGYEGLKETFGELRESFAGIVWDPIEIHDLGGGRYLLKVRVSGRGKGSGLAMDMEIGHLFTLRDGRASQLDVFFDWDRAREAAGLI